MLIILPFAGAAAMASTLTCYVDMAGRTKIRGGSR